MGKIFQSRRWFTVAICCALAAALHLGLTEYATRTTVTYCDGGIVKTRGPDSDPIIPGSSSISDTFCMSPAKKGHRAVAAWYDQSGLYPRGHIPRIFALGLGVAIPVILILSAAFVVLRNGRSVLRTFAIMTLAAFGLLTLGVWIVGMASDFSSIPSRYLFNYAWPLVIPAVFFSGTYWLSRKRSPKEPS